MLLEGSQGRQTLFLSLLCWQCGMQMDGCAVLRWACAVQCKRKKMRQVESGGVVNKAFA